ncbi:MAG: hypothetical protein HC810_04245 [Acaryochloridaceae cyanobacterium RL_2_7]|nr:hypothetical protein [Acaryochloridaceae cyanobacterium RL_2_7]
MGEVLDMHWISVDQSLETDSDPTDKRQEEAFSLPPLESIEHLLRLAERGLMSRIQEEVQQLKQINVDWHPFLRTLEQHAANFEVEKLKLFYKDSCPLSPLNVGKMVWGFVDNQ